MMNLTLRILPALALAALAPSSFAIHVEPDQPDFQSPKAQLVESARAAEAQLSGGPTSISASNFTGFNDAVKRKAFPPGYGRSGYQFEDELTNGAVQQKDEAAAESSAVQRAPSPEAPKP